MKNLIVSTLLLVALTSSASAQEKEKWRSAMRETDKDWQQAKDEFQNGMTAYFFNAYEHDRYELLFNDLDRKVKALEKEVNRTMPEGLNEATKKSWETKNKNDKAKLETMTTELETYRSYRDQAAGTLKLFDPAAIKQRLDDAAKSANLNASVNEKNETFRGKKVLKATHDGKVSNQVFLDLRKKADQEAAYRFSAKYNNETPPPSRRLMKTVPVKVDASTTTTVSNTSASTTTPITQTSPTPSPTMAPLVVTGNQTSVVTPVVSNPPNPGAVKACEDEHLKTIHQIIKEDKNNAFAKMYELTVMRLAKKALSEGNATLEGFTKKKISALEGYFKSSKEAGEVQEKVKQAYEAYGKPADITAINNDLDAALARGKKGCYWSMNTRLYNEHAAAYVLAMSAADPKSGVTDADAATIWAVEKIRAGAGAGYAQGTQNGNLMNVSNRVARYLGAIQSKAIKADELEKSITGQEEEFKKLIDSAYAQVKESLRKCLNGADPATSCAEEAAAKFESNHLNLAAIQRALAGEVMKSKNIETTSKLKGKIGEMSFDLNNFSRDSVLKDPARISKFDSCGQPRKPASTTTTKSQDPIDRSNMVAVCANPYHPCSVVNNPGMCCDSFEGPVGPVTWVPKPQEPEKKKFVPVKNPHSGRYWKAGEMNYNGKPKPCSQVCPLEEATGCDERDLGSGIPGEPCCCKSSDY